MTRKEHMKNDINISKRELFDRRFNRLPGFIHTRNGNVSPHAQGQLGSRSERRKAARAYAAGDWKRLQALVKLHQAA